MFVFSESSTTAFLQPITVKLSDMLDTIQDGMAVRLIGTTINLQNTLIFVLFWEILHSSLNTRG